MWHFLWSIFSFSIQSLRIFVTLHEILDEAIEANASDTNIYVDQPLAFRIKGQVVIMKTEEFFMYRKNVNDLIVELKHNSKALKELYDPAELDGSYTYTGRDGLQYYFRFNVALSQFEPHITIRKLINEIPDKDKIKMNEGDGLKFFNECMKQQEGLYLVIGATGSGKSTTLTCVVDSLLQKGGLKAITLEEPIEYRYDPLRYLECNSIILQRAVGFDTDSFYMGLRAAMRQNPDIILVGEIRDKETASAALQAANTGHQVLATLHASSVDLAIERIRFLVGDITNDYSFVKAIMSQKLEKIDGNIVPIRNCKVSSELQLKL